MLLGTHARNHTISNTRVNVAGASVPLSTTLKLLGVHLYNNLNFSKHVNSVSKACHFHLRALSHIGSTLDLDAAKLIGHALVDYCNSLLQCSRAIYFQTPTSPECCRKTLQTLPLHSLIVCTGSFQNQFQNCHNHLQVITLTNPQQPCFHASPLYANHSSNSLLLSSHPAKTNFGLSFCQCHTKQITN